MSPITPPSKVLAYTLFTSNAVIYRNRLQRVVYTSSCGAIKAFTSVPKTYSEDDWNDQAVQDCKDLGEKALPNDMYAASKTLAEQGEGLQYGPTDKWEAELYMLDIQSYGNGIAHIKKK